MESAQQSMFRWQQPSITPFDPKWKEWYKSDGRALFMETGICKESYSITITTKIKMCTQTMDFISKVHDLFISGNVSSWYYVWSRRSSCIWSLHGARLLSEQFWEASGQLGVRQCHRLLTKQHYVSKTSICNSFARIQSPSGTSRVFTTHLGIKSWTGFDKHILKAWVTRKVTRKTFRMTFSNL